MASSSSGKDIQVKKRKEDASTASVKDKPDPHICLKCGSEISRGRDFNKKRHWKQKHPGEQEGDYAKSIVPKDHELARNLLREMASISGYREQADESKSKKEQAETKIDSNLGDNALPSDMCELHAPVKNNDLGAVGANPRPVQRSLTNFLVTKEKLSPVEKLQGDINQMLVMLQSLTIPEKNIYPKRQIQVTNDATAILTASNPLEVEHPDICVEILEDGCKVTCYTCQQYHLSQSKTV